MSLIDSRTDIIIHPDDQLDPKVAYFARQINGFIKEEYEHRIAKDSAQSKLYYRSFHDESDADKKGTFGYYISPTVVQLFELMTHFKCRKIVDLGSGAGIMLRVLKKLFIAHNDYNTVIEGFEFDPALVNEANYSQGIHTKLQDILQLKKEMLEKYECVYFWEPFCEKEKAKLFVKSLIRSLTKDHYVFYHPAGSIGEEMKASKRFHYLGGYNGIRVFKKA